MKEKKIYRVLSIIFSAITIIMVGFLIINNRDMLFLVIIPVLLASMFHNAYVKSKQDKN